MINKRTKLAAGSVSLAAAAALTFTGCTGTDEEKTTPVPQSPAETQSEATPRDDVLGLRLVDDGIGDVYVKYEVKNHGEVRSDYVILFEAVNDKGTRVGEEYLYVDNVAPGQTVKGEQFTFLPVKTAGMDTNILEFDRYKG